VEIWLLLLVGVAAAGAGAGTVWVVMAFRVRELAVQAAQLQHQTGKTEEELKAARYEANRWRTQAETDSLARAVAETKLTEQEHGSRERLDALTAIRGGIEKDLKNIAADSLRENQSAFLQLANEVFDKHKQGASAELTP